MDAKSEGDVQDLTFRDGKPVPWAYALPPASLLYSGISSASCFQPGSGPPGPPGAPFGLPFAYYPAVPVGHYPGAAQPQHHGRQTRHGALISSTSCSTVQRPGSSNYMEETPLLAASTGAFGDPRVPPPPAFHEVVQPRQKDAGPAADAFAAPPFVSGSRAGPHAAADAPVVQPGARQGGRSPLPQAVDAPADLDAGVRSAGPPSHAACTPSPPAGAADAPPAPPDGQPAAAAGCADGAGRGAASAWIGPGRPTFSVPAPLANGPGPPRAGQRPLHPGPDQVPLALPKPAPAAQPAGAGPPGLPNILHPASHLMDEAQYDALRGVILGQQELFLQQLYELHRLVRVQRLLVPPLDGDSSLSTPLSKQQLEQRAELYGACLRLLLNVPPHLRDRLLARRAPPPHLSLACMRLPREEARMRGIFVPVATRVTLPSDERCSPEMSAHQTVQQGGGGGGAQGSGSGSGSGAKEGADAVPVAAAEVAAAAAAPSVLRTAPADAAAAAAAVQVEPLAAAAATAAPVVRKPLVVGTRVNLQAPAAAGARVAPAAAAGSGCVELQPQLASAAPAAAVQPPSPAPGFPRLMLRPPLQPPQGEPTAASMGQAYPYLPPPPHWAPGLPPPQAAALAAAHHQHHYHHHHHAAVAFPPAYTRGPPAMLLPHHQHPGGLPPGAMVPMPFTHHHMMPMPLTLRPMYHVDPHAAWFAKHYGPWVGGVPAPHGAPAAAAPPPGPGPGAGPATAVAAVEQQQHQQQQAHPAPWPGSFHPPQTTAGSAPASGAAATQAEAAAPPPVRVALSAPAAASSQVVRWWQDPVKTFGEAALHMPDPLMSGGGGAGGGGPNRTNSAAIMPPPPVPLGRLGGSNKRSAQSASLDAAGPAGQVAVASSSGAVGQMGGGTLLRGGAASDDPNLKSGSAGIVIGAGGGASLSLGKRSSSATAAGGSGHTAAAAAAAAAAASPPQSQPPPEKRRQVMRATDAAGQGVGADGAAAAGAGGSPAAGPSAFRRLPPRRTSARSKRGSNKLTRAESIGSDNSSSIDKGHSGGRQAGSDRGGRGGRSGGGAGGSAHDAAAQSAKSAAGILLSLSSSFHCI